MDRDEYEMPPPPPSKKQKTVSSKPSDAKADKEKSSALPKKAAPAPSVLQLLQKGKSAKELATTGTPSSSEEHVSDPNFSSIYLPKNFPAEEFFCRRTPYPSSPRADARFLANRALAFEYRV